MTSRREFLQTAAVLSAAPLAGSAAFAGNGAPATPDARRVMAFDAVLFDARFQSSRDFSRRANVLGAPLRVIEGDITELWQREFNRRWKQGPVVVAGLTDRHALFLLEHLAWEHRLSVVFEAEHSPAAYGAVTHRILRSADVALASVLSTAGTDWPQALADAMIGGGAVPAREYGPTGAAMAAHPGEADKLYSWIIAPRGAA